jgi:hypothetical protein
MKVMQSQGIPSIRLLADCSKALQSTSSFISSIESEIKKRRLENGRVYAAYGKNGKTQTRPWK